MNVDEQVAMAAQNQQLQQQLVDMQQRLAQVDAQVGAHVQAVQQEAGAQVAAAQAQIQDADMGQAEQAAAAALANLQYNIMRDATRSLSNIPKYRSGQSWACFEKMIELFMEQSIDHRVPNDFKKRAILRSLYGDNICITKCSALWVGTVAYNQCVTWQDLLAEIRNVFLPPAESSLAREEFKSLVQAKTQDVSSYLLLKEQLFVSAYGLNGDFSTLLDYSIEGLVNLVIKRQLRRSNPQNPRQMIESAVLAVAQERAGFKHGYSESSNLDGLWSSSAIALRSGAQDEGMDISAMGEKGKRKDIICHQCQMKGHIKSQCRVDPSKWPKNKAKPARPSGPKKDKSITLTCYYCNKLGHKSSECRKKQKDIKEGKCQPCKKPGVKQMEEFDQESEEYRQYEQHFLGTTQARDEEG